MKRTALLLLWGCLLFCMRGYSQTISYTGKNIPLEKIFTEIEKQTGYVVVYNYEVIKGAKGVTVDVKRKALEEFLKLVLEGQGLGFRVSKGNIVISRKMERNGVMKDLLSDSLINIQGTVLNSQNVAVVGATVSVKGTNIGTSTASDGSFSLQGVKKNAILLISSVGYESMSVKVTGESTISIQLAIRAESMVEVTVVNTGYQKLPKERATGSFTFVDSALYNRAVGGNVLNRLEGVAGGVQFIKGQRTQNERLGISIRGRTTLDDKVSADPLVILDNFPYEGEISNINPNDVESVTILKDASAAAIWGVRSGNGVIVITTKKGVLNKKPELTFNVNYTVASRPDLYYQKLLNSTQYIEIEEYLFNQGYFNSDLINVANRPVVSPVVEILNKQNLNQLSNEEAILQLNALRNTDVRHDYKKYLYQNSKNQQYSLSLRGGANSLTYYLSAGFDKVVNSSVGSESKRLTLNASNTYTPIKNLEFTTRIIYTTDKLDNNSLPAISTGGKYNTVLPYTRLVDENGNSIAITKDFRTNFVDSIRNLGYIDWRYRPMDELNLMDNTVDRNHLLIGARAKYNFTTFLSFELDYQTERQTIKNRNYQSIQTYYARNLVNKFSIRNSIDGTFKYQLPKGGVLDLIDNQLTSNNLRAQLSFNKELKGNHTLNGIIGGEIRETKANGFGRRSYGYDDEYGTAASTINYSQYLPIYPVGIDLIQNVDQGYNTVTDRFIDYYVLLSYSYLNKYTITATGRKEGSNVFGVNINDQMTPLWSLGAAWELSRETFYNSGLVPYLKLRATYGYNGNVYNASSYLTAVYSTSSLTNLQIASITSPPNPELRWEKIRNINLGVDFEFKKRILTGSIEFWQKDGKDLIEDAPLAPSTGFPVFKGNAAATRTKGVEVTLNTKNISRGFKWNSSFIFQAFRDKVVSFDPKFPTNSIIVPSSKLSPIVGKPIFSLFAYKWGGLDEQNGDPVGYLGKDKSKDYTTIVNSSKIEDLVFKGSTRPTVSGSLLNSFSYKNITLSVNIIYNFGYYFRRNSVSGNYTDLLNNSNGYADYALRWQKSGDENNTSVPSIVYPNIPVRASFYQGSEILIEKGDHIRLQDIQAGFNIDKKIWRDMPMKSLQLYVYANNLGVIWKANKQGIDPNFVTGNQAPFSISFGIKTTL